MKHTTNHNESSEGHSSHHINTTGTLLIAGAMSANIALADLPDGTLPNFKQTEIAPKIEPEHTLESAQQYLANKSEDASTKLGATWTLNKLQHIGMMQYKIDQLEWQKNKTSNTYGHFHLTQQRYSYERQINMFKNDFYKNISIATKNDNTSTQFFKWFFRTHELENKVKQKILNDFLFQSRS